MEYEINTYVLMKLSVVAFLGLSFKQGRFLKFFGFYFTVNVLDGLFSFNTVISVSTARSAALPCKQFVNKRTCTCAHKQFVHSLYGTLIISLAIINLFNTQARMNHR